MNIDGWQARVFFLTWAILSGSSASVAPLSQTSAFFQPLRSLSVSRLHSSYFVYYWSLQICNAGNSVNTLKGKRKWKWWRKQRGERRRWSLGNTPLTSTSVYMAGNIFFSFLFGNDVFFLLFLHFFLCNFCCFKVQSLLFGYIHFCL